MDAITGFFGVFTLILTGFGIFGGWTFNKFTEDIKELKSQNQNLNTKLDFLQRENTSLGQFLNSFLLRFSITANKNSVKVDQQITDLITNSQKELDEIINFFKNSDQAGRFPKQN